MTTDAVHGGLRVAIEVHDDVVLVALTGSLDIYTVPGFRRDVDPYAHAGDPIVIDLAGVTLVDSSGLRALVSLRNRVQREGPERLALVCPQRHLLRVLEMTGLRRAFDFGLPSSRRRPGSGVTPPAGKPSPGGSAAQPTRHDHLPFSVQEGDPRRSLARASLARAVQARPDL